MGWGSVDHGAQARLESEVAAMPASAAVRAADISQIGPLQELRDLVPAVRRRYGAQLAAVHHAVDERLDRLETRLEEDSLEYPFVASVERGCFYAALELALIAELWRGSLRANQYTAMRAPWDHLREE
jgi:hypothetical protein